jgi:hypothetical protein
MIQCPKCGSALYDNRADKASGVKSPKWPDLKCQNKACDFAQWPPKVKASPIATPFVPPVVPQAHGGANGRDAALVALYWACFDEVMEGVARRKLTDLFRPEHLCAAISTLYIQRAKG